MHPRARARTFLAAACVVLVAACTTSRTGSAAPAATPRAATTAPDTASVTPVSLVGTWRVGGAAGEPEGTVLRIEGPSQPEQLILFHPCGPLSGGWVGSNSGGFLGILFSFPMACLRSIGSGDPTPSWLAAARSFVVDGTERQLLAADGRVVARLLPGGRAPSGSAAPALTPSDRQALSSPIAALPSSAPPPPSRRCSGAGGRIRRGTTPLPGSPSCPSRRTVAGAAPTAATPSVPPGDWGRLENC